MSKPSRRTIRAALIAGLRGQLSDVTSSKIIGYQPKLDGSYPIVTVLGRGTKRPPLTTRGTQTIFSITVVTYVVREASDLTRDAAENLLDDLEAQIAAYFETVKGNTNNWVSLDYSEPSSVSLFVEEGGLVYLTESILLTIAVN